MSESNKSRRQIAIFLLLLFAFSAVFYFLILIAHRLNAGNGLYVSGLMWCPALAAIATLKVSGRNLSELGWKWPKTRYALATYCAASDRSAVGRYRLAEIKFNWLPTNIIQSGRSLSCSLFGSRF